MTEANEKFLNAAKTTVADLSDMSATALGGFGKLMELNMSTAKAAMADAAAQMQAGLAMKSPQDLGSVTDQVQPMADKAAAYGRAVAGIVTETTAALTKANEARMADMKAQAVASIEAAMKNAPAGSEAAVSAFKNALSTSQAAMETAQSQAKQAMETAGKHFATATDMAVKASKTAAKSK